MENEMQINDDCSNKKREQKTTKIKSITDILDTDLGKVFMENRFERKPTCYFLRQPSFSQHL